MKNIQFDCTFLFASRLIWHSQRLPPLSQQKHQLPASKQHQQQVPPTKQQQLPPPNRLEQQLPPQNQQLIWIPIVAIMIAPSP